MKKVLLVDDDALVRMFLRQVIPWEAEGYEVVGDARDGEEALEMAAQFSPELIVSDVSMPSLDGVKLVRRLRDRQYPGGIIMLSCHDDFEYVKNAMQLGADEYLLKNHLSAETLRAALQTVAEKRAAVQAAPAIAELAQKGQRALQQEVLERLLAGDSSDSEQALLRKAGFGGRYAVCTVVFLRVSAEANWQSIFELCCQMTSAGDLSDVETVQVGRHGCVFLIDLTGQPSEMARLDRARSLAARVELGLKSYLQLEPAMGVSRPCSGAHAVSEAMRQANEALIASFYGPDTYWFGTGEAILTEDVPEDAQKFLENLPALLTTDAVTLEAAYTGTLAAFAKARTLPGVVLRWLQNCDAAAGVVRPPRKYAELRTLAACRACVEAYLSQLQNLTSLQVPQNLSPPIAAAVRYLQTHFSEPVTLGDAASAAGFNPSYFSAVFKRELGVGFSEYLTDLRLSTVRRQLLESTGTIKEIAQHAGFLDYRHFCKTFKTKTGISPAEYRKESQK